MKSSEVLETYTKGEIICANNKNYFDANFIPISNLIAVATDGAPSMVGKNRGLIAHLKELQMKTLAHMFLIWKNYTKICVKDFRTFLVCIFLIGF